MGRSSRRKTKEVVVEEQEERRGLKPGAAALLLLGLGLGTMIVWNAFLGKHQPRNIEALLAEVPEGATTSVVVNAPDKAGRIVIKYDRVVEDLQQELTTSGHYKGVVDGVMGQRTALAIKQYQKELGLAVDGAASAELLDHIRFTRKIAQASDQTGSIAPQVVKPKQIAAAKPDNRRVVTLDVQMRLKSLGYDPGSTDGIASESLRAAILQFEMDQGLAMEGKITKTLLAAIKSAERGESLAAQ